MNRSELIEKIDNSLATGVDATRQAHVQIQQILQQYREEVQLRQAKQERDNQQPPTNDGEQ